GQSQGAPTRQCGDTRRGGATRRMARRRPQPGGPGRKGPPCRVTRRRQPEQGWSPPRSLRGDAFRPGALAWCSQTEPSAGSAAGGCPFVGRPIPAPDTSPRAPREPRLANALPRGRLTLTARVARFFLSALVVFRGPVPCRGSVLA